MYIYIYIYTYIQIYNIYINIHVYFTYFESAMFVGTSQCLAQVEIRATHAEGATEASQEGAEGHDAVAELVAEGILDLPRTGGQGQVELMWMKRNGIQCHHYPISA